MGVSPLSLSATPTTEALECESLYPHKFTEEEFPSGFSSSFYSHKLLIISHYSITASRIPTVASALGTIVSRRASASIGISG